MLKLYLFSFVWFLSKTFFFEICQNEEMMGWKFNMQKLTIATFIGTKKDFTWFFFNYLSNYVMETFEFSLFGQI
jgi:hypothetical protein